MTNMLVSDVSVLPWGAEAVVGHPLVVFSYSQFLSVFSSFPVNKEIYDIKKNTELIHIQSTNMIFMNTNVQIPLAFSVPLSDCTVLRKF